MKATDLLKKQHKEVKALFKKVEKTEDTRQRRQLMEQISTALEAHASIEEEMFYPAVKGLETKKAEEMVAEAFEEHHVVKLVLAELPNVDPEDERFEELTGDRRRRAAQSTRGAARLRRGAERGGHGGRPEPPM